MDPTNPNESMGNYFALPRLVKKLRGGSAIRSEDSWLEAYLAGTVAYLISYLFAARLLFNHVQIWQAVVAWPILFVVMWIFWLIVLYANSLLVKIAQAFGLCSNLSRKRVQSVLIGILTTVFSAELMTSGSRLRWVGALWMIAVALNLISALLLALLHDERS